MLNGWKAASWGFAAPTYTRKSDGTVHLDGNISSGQVGAAAFRLPADCRPNDPSQFPAVLHRSEFGSIMVTAEGEVVPSKAGENVPLVNVTFQAKSQL
ncbi:MAG: hypothetical protein ABI218_02840 [Caldimonas sp.]